MNDPIYDEPLLTRLYKWLRMMSYCPDSAIFSMRVLGRSGNYYQMWKATKFQASANVLLTARKNLAILARGEAKDARRIALDHLVEAIDLELGTATERRSAGAEVVNGTA